MFEKAIVGVGDVDAGVEAVALARDLGATELTLAGWAPAALEAVGDRAAAGARLVTLEDRGRGRALERAARAVDADLLVVGPAPDGQLAQILRRDLGCAALHHASTPIAVARPRPLPGTPRTVAVGYDGSRQSRAAVHVAARWAAEQGAALSIMVAWTTPAVPMTPGAPLTSATEAARDAQGWLDAILEELPGRTAGRVVHGTANAELVRASENVDLLVVGSGQPGPVARALIGSTAEWVMRHAACPVLVVPRGATQPTEAADAPPAVVIARGS